MAKDSYCWLSYYDSDTLKTSKSDELKYADKHQHGVQPTEAQWDSLLPSLTQNVNKVRKEKGFPDLELTVGQCDKNTRTAK